jgi:integrase
VPGPERRAAHAPGAAALVAAYDRWLEAGGRGSRCYHDGAWAFLGRWNDPAAYAAEPLTVQLAAGSAQRPFVTFLMLTGRLRPGYDYLAHRKIGGLITQARRSVLAADLTRFTTAATDLDYGGHIIKRSAERVVLRLLIHTGRPLSGVTTADLDELAAAFRRCAEAKGNRRSWANDRSLVHAAHQVLFHLGILDAPPEDPRRRHGLAGHYSGVGEPLRTLFLDYCTQAAATRAPATVKSIASHLAGFGRFLASLDPPLTDLAMLDRRAHIEPWLAFLAEARHPDGTPMSAGYRRGQILTIRQFLADMLEWGWPAAPARTLIFARDIPLLEHPLPRYLPPDADRRLAAALEDRSAHGATELTRLHADALLLVRATGLRIGEVRDLELDCVHQIPGNGAWLKVPLGKLASERMVPLDEETLQVLDRIAARRTPGRPLRHPRTGMPADFLLAHQGRRVSAQALRDELTRACQDAGIPKAVPHALRHTYATALVNAGVSLQA